MTDPAVGAEFLVAGPDGVPVCLSGPPASPPSVALLPEGLAGGGDGVQRDDVAERSDVRIADQREWALQKMGIISRVLHILM